MKMRFFEIAKKLSEKADYQHKLGAVVVDKNKPIGFGFNKPSKTHPRSNHPFGRVHAELDAILNAGLDCKGASIYIYREHKDGTPAEAKPCKYCQVLLNSVGIKRIFYTSEGTFKELK